MKEKIAARSVNRKLSSLKSLFKYLERQQIIEINPMAKITGPKTPKRLPVFVDEHQMENLFNSVKFEDNFNGVRDRLILDLFYQTGIRRSELTHLKEIDLDLFNSTIKVLGKRNKERILPLLPSTQEIVTLYLRKRKEIESHGTSQKLILSKKEIK